MCLRRLDHELGDPTARRPRSAHDSTLASRYLSAGLVVFGATKVPPFSVTIDTDRARYGSCRNPWDPIRTPGGSPSGAAAVVASDAIPMAHGNDGGGSLRIPSAWSGAFTVKPSRGRLPDGPVCTEGWPARPYLEETQHECRPLRVALMTATHSGGAFHPHHADATRRTADLLAELGHHVEEAAPVIPLDDLSLQLYLTVAVDITNALDTIGRTRWTRSARSAAHRSKTASWRPSSRCSASEVAR